MADNDCGRCGFYADYDKEHAQKSTHEVVAEAENGKVAVERYKQFRPIS